MIMALIIEQ